MARKNEEKQTFIALERLRLDGESVMPGEEVELSEAQARHLFKSKKVALPGGDAAASALLQQQAGELQERLKGDFAAVKAEREAAEKALDDAKAERTEAEAVLAKATEEREAAAKDLEAAKTERAEAEKARDETKKLAGQAEKDSKAAEKAAKK